MTHLTSLIIARFVALLPAGLRIAGVVFFAPGLGAERAPARFRIALALGLAAVIVPVCVREVPPITAPTAYILTCLGELAFGIALGFALRVLLEAMRFGGEILDLQIGLRAGQLFDPATGAQSGILSTGYYLIALIIFIQIDGHHWLLRGMAASFAIAPVGGLSYDPGLCEVVADLGESVFALGLRLAGPVVAALVLADLAFGLVARAVPQINVFIVGIPAKIALGFIVAALGMPLVCRNLGSIVELMSKYLDLIVRAFAGQ
jgi:flagellar biosynthetic protein FliR